MALGDSEQDHGTIVFFFTPNPQASKDIVAHIFNRLPIKGGNNDKRQLSSGRLLDPGCIAFEGRTAAGVDNTCVIADVALRLESFPVRSVASHGSQTQ